MIPLHSSTLTSKHTTGVGSLPSFISLSAVNTWSMLLIEFVCIVVFAGIFIRVTVTMIPAPIRETIIPAPEQGPRVELFMQRVNQAYDQYYRRYRDSYRDPVNDGIQRYGRLRSESEINAKKHQLWPLYAGVLSNDFFDNYEDMDARVLTDIEQAELAVEAKLKQDLTGVYYAEDFVGKNSLGAIVTYYLSSFVKAHNRNGFTSTDTEIDHLRSNLNETYSWDDIRNDQQFKHRSRGVDTTALPLLKIAPIVEVESEVDIFTTYLYSNPYVESEVGIFTNHLYSNPDLALKPKPEITTSNIGDVDFPTPEGHSWNDTEIYAPIEWNDPILTLQITDDFNSKAMHQYFVKVGLGIKGPSLTREQQKCIRWKYKTTVINLPRSFNLYQLHKSIDFTPVDAKINAELDQLEITGDLKVHFAIKKASNANGIILNLFEKLLLLSGVTSIFMVLCISGFDITYLLSDPKGIVAFTGISAFIILNSVIMAVINISLIIRTAEMATPELPGLVYESDFKNYLVAKVFPVLALFSGVIMIILEYLVLDIFQKLL